MKKIVSILMIFVLILSMNAFSVGARSAYIISDAENKSTIVEYFEDGSYLEVTITKETSDVMPLADSYITDGTKTYTYKNSSGTTLWWYNLHGNFRVTTGSSAVCTSALESYSIQEDGWSLKESSTSKSGNKAMGNATFIKKVLFITAETKNISLTLTCDKNGNLS